MELLKNYLILSAFLMIYILSVSCSDRTDEILDIIYNDTVVNISSKTSGKLLDEKISLIFTLTNKEEQNIYIPTAFFHIQSSIGGGRILFTSPDNTFDNTFILNTIHIYPKHTDISSLSHMNGGEILDKMPFFMRIKPNQTATFNITFPNDYINSGNRRKRLIDSTQYVAHLKIAVIKEDKFISILELISKHKQLDFFVTNNNTLEINSKSIDTAIKESLKLSEIKIDEYQSKVINELCNVKIDFVCDIENRNFK